MMSFNRWRDRVLPEVLVLPKHDVVEVTRDQGDRRV
jgi:hypothetical protein